jgi:hypothetical protein
MAGVSRWNLGQEDSCYHLLDLSHQEGVLSQRLSSRVTLALKRGVLLTGEAKARAGHLLESR